MKTEQRDTSPTFVLARVHLSRKRFDFQKMSGRLDTIDKYLCLHKYKRPRSQPEDSHTSPASSSQKFTKFILGLDLLAHELYHPKKFLLSVKQEYLQWIEQAEQELEQRNKHKEQRSVQHQPEMKTHTKLTSQQQLLQLQLQQQASFINIEQQHNTTKHLQPPPILSRDEMPQFHATAPPKKFNTGTSKPILRGPPASLTRRRAISRRTNTRTRTRTQTPRSTNRPNTSSSINSFLSTSSTDTSFSASKSNDNYSNYPTSEILKADYVYEKMSVMPSARDSKSVALRDEYIYSEKEDAWKRIVFPSKIPTDKRNATELETWFTNKIQQVDQELNTKGDDGPWVASVQKQMSKELPVLSLAVRELERQLTACHISAKNATKGRPGWTMHGANNENNATYDNGNQNRNGKNDGAHHVDVLKSAWRGTVIMMGDVVEWAKLQQAENELTYAAQNDVIESVRAAKTDSLQRLKEAQQRYAATCGKTDVMRRINEQRENTREQVLREYLKVGLEVSALQQNVQDLLRDEHISKKLNMGKIHMFLSTIEMMIDQMNECVDNEPAHIFLFRNHQTKNGQIIENDANDDIEVTESESNILKEDHWNDDDEEEEEEEDDEDDDDEEEEEEEEEDDEDLEDDEREDDPELHKPTIEVRQDDIQRLATLNIKIMELRHLIARLTSTSCFRIHSEAGTQTDDMLLGSAAKNENNTDGSTSPIVPEELRPSVLAHGVFIQLYNMWRSHGVKPMHVFGRLDADGGGSVDQKEFRLGLSRHYKIDLSKLQVDAVYSILDADGSGTIEHKEFSRAVKSAGRGVPKEQREKSTKGKGKVTIEEKPSYVVPACMKNLLSAVPDNYTPMNVTLQTVHLLIWQVYGYAAQRLNGSQDGRIRLPEIITDYFVLKFQEPHAAQVRVVDFLTAVHSFGNSSGTSGSGSGGSGSGNASHSIRVDGFLRLLEKSNQATQEAERNAIAHGKDVNNIRPKGTDDCKHFTTVLRQLTKHLGSMHAFVENYDTGLHVVDAPTARRVLRDMPSYRMVSDDLRKSVNDTIDQSSQMMASQSGHKQGEFREQIEMIDVDDVLHLAMSLWYEERKRAKKRLEDMFVDGDENDDGFLTLDEFRDLIEKVDPRRSGVEVTHMYREALSLTVTRSMSGGKVSSVSTSGGITPGAFATIGIRHGLLVMPELSVNIDHENEQDIQKEATDIDSRKTTTQTTVVPKKLSQEENDALVFSGIASTWKKQRNDVLKKVVTNEKNRRLFDEFEKLLMDRKDLGRCMAVFGELELILSEDNKE